jgi:hypothetical protein
VQSFRHFGIAHEYDGSEPGVAQRLDSRYAGKGVLILERDQRAQAGNKDDGSVLEREHPRSESAADARHRRRETVLVLNTNKQEAMKSCRTFDPRITFVCQKEMNADQIVEARATSHPRSPDPSNVPS